MNKLEVNLVSGNWVEVRLNGERINGVISVDKIDLELNQVTITILGEITTKIYGEVVQLKK